MIGLADYQSHRAAEVIIGVDTHRDQHVAVAIDGRGVRLGERYVPATTRGYEEIELWSCSLGEVRAFGIEGTGSYGAGVARFMAGRGHTGVKSDLAKMRSVELAFTRQRLLETISLQMGRQNGRGHSE